MLCTYWFSSVVLEFQDQINRHSKYITTIFVVIIVSLQITLKLPHASQDEVTFGSPEIKNWHMKVLLTWNDDISYFSA